MATKSNKPKKEGRKPKGDRIDLIKRCSERVKENALQFNESEKELRL